MSEYQTQYGQSYALVMGIDAYKNLNPLSAAVRGAKALADTLDSEYDFDVTLMTDKHVTRDSVFNWLNRLAQESGPDDRVIIFFAGHGLTRGTDLYERGYLALRESELEKWHTMLAMDDIIEEARFLPAKHLLYLLDCCFGGLALDTRSAGDVPRELEYYLTRQVRYAIAAGGKEVVDDALAPGFEYSLFTHHLLTWLSSERVQPPGGIWRARELGNYLERAVARDRRSGHKPNHNYMSGSGDGDFLFKWEDNPMDMVTSGLGSALSSTSWQVRQGAVAAMIDMARGDDPERVQYALAWLSRIAEGDENDTVRETAQTFLTAWHAEPDPNPIPETDEIPRPEPELVPVPRAVDIPDDPPLRSFVRRWGLFFGVLVAGILAGIHPLGNSDVIPFWSDFVYDYRTAFGLVGAALLIAITVVIARRHHLLVAVLSGLTALSWVLGTLYDLMIDGTALDFLWSVRFAPFVLPVPLLIWLGVLAARDRG